ncbi:hypothetical protein Xoosp13_36 [Xanthomonas phage Xoo-sp13]|nr:hypothetical protein Xoosp13_36 [Xanthomonas phage Xoo-sp13]
MNLRTVKAYVQFWQLSTGYVEGSIPPQFGERKPIHATGDRSVVILDARQSYFTWKAIAADECKKRGYIGYSIVYHGTPDNMKSVEHLTDLQTISNRINAAA